MISLTECRPRVAMYTKQNVGIIYYINLDHRIDRRSFMEAQLKQNGLPYKRFSAIEPDVESLISTEGTYHEFYRRATPRFKSYVSDKRLHKRAIGVFGCYISHFMIHKQMVDKNIGDYMIIEDDCSVSPEALSILFNTLSDGRIADDWDIIRNCSKSTTTVQKFTGSHHESIHGQSAVPHNYHGGTHFSLFRGSSAGKVLDYLRNDVVLAIDAAYSTHMLNVYHGDFGLHTADFGTDIPKLRAESFRWDRRLARFLRKRLRCQQ